MAGLETVYATHNFVAENGDEISFKVGEPVIVLEKDEGYQDGWWQGRNIHGEIGLFPMNYTSFKQPVLQSLETKIDSLETAIKQMDITTAKPKVSTDLPPTPSISNSSRHSSTLPPPQPASTTTTTTNNNNNNNNNNQIYSSASSLSSYPQSIHTNSSSTMAPDSYQKKLSTKYVHQSVYTSLQNTQLKTSLPEDWSVEQVAIWLGLMGFSDIATTFEKQEITGDILLELNVESLKELNVSTFGKRFKIVNAIKVLSDENMKRKVSIDHQSDNNSTLNPSSLSPTSLTPSMTPPSSNTTTMTSNHTIPYTDDDDLISDYSSIIKKSLQSPTSRLSSTMATSSTTTTAEQVGQMTTNINPSSSSSSNTSYAPILPNNKSPLISPTTTTSSHLSLSSTNYNPLNPSSDNTMINHHHHINTQPLMNHNESGLIQRSATPLNRSLSTSAYQPSYYLNNSNKPLNYSQSLNKSNTMYNISNPMPSDQPHHRISVDQIGRPSISSLKNINSSQNNSRSRYNFVRNSFLNTTKTQNNVLLSSSRVSMDGIAQRLDKENSLPDMEGWLYKQGDKYKTWNKRWFVLKEANFFYFKSPKDTRMKGIINLHGYQILADENIYPGKYCFKLQHERERTFYFHTDTELSLKTWMNKLLKSTITRDYSSPVMSSNDIPTVSLDVARRMKPRPPSTIFGKEFDSERPLSSTSHYDSRPFSLTYSEQPQPIMRMSMSDETHHLYPPNNNQTQESGLLGNEDELFSHHHHHSSFPSSSPPPSSPPPPPPTSSTTIQSHQPQPLPSISSSSTITDHNKKKKINSMIYYHDDDEDLVDPLQRPSSSMTNQTSSFHDDNYSSNKIDLTSIQQQEQQRKDSFHIIHDRIEELDNEDEEDEDHDNLDASWQWEEKDYLQWINQHLMNNDNDKDNHHHHHRHVKLNHITELRTGENLILLLEAISGKQVRRPASTLHHDPSVPLTNMQMLDYLVASFKFMGREGVLVDGRYTIKDIFSGNESKIIEMLRTIKDWANQLHPSSDKKASGCTFGENEEGILDELEEA